MVVMLRVTDFDDFAKIKKGKNMEEKKKSY